MQFRIADTFTDDVACTRARDRLEHDKRGFTLTLPQSKDLVDENGEPRLVTAHPPRKRDAGRT